MQKQRSLTFQFGINILLKLSTYIFPLAAFPYVSRVLLPAGVGRVSFALSVVNYFMIFAQLGIPTYGIKVCAQAREDKEKLSRTVQELFFLSMITTVIAYAALFLFIFFVPRLWQDRTLLLGMSVAILLKTMGMEWLYRALEQYEYMASRTAVIQIAALVLLFFGVHESGDTLLYGVLLVLAAQAVGVFNFFHARRYISVKFLGGYRIKRHIKPAVVLFAMSCAVMVYTNLDTTMLGMLRTDTEVGYYNAAVNVKTVLANLLMTIGTVLLPRTSWYYEKGRYQEFRQMANKAIRAVCLAAPALILYFILFARESILLLSGSGYEGAVLPMQIILPALLPIGLTNIMGVQLLVPMGKEKVTLYSVGVGAAVDFALNIVLIPKCGAAGAAAGTLAAEISVWLVQYFYIRKEITGLYQGLQYGMLVTASILGALASAWVKLLRLPAFAALVISAVLFFGAYGIVLLLWREPILVTMLAKGRQMLASQKRNRRKCEK